LNRKKCDQTFKIREKNIILQKSKNLNKRHDRGASHSEYGDDTSTANEELQFSEDVLTNTSSCTIKWIPHLTNESKSINKRKRDEFQLKILLHLLSSIFQRHTISKKNLRSGLPSGSGMGGLAFGSLLPNPAGL